MMLRILAAAIVVTLPLHAWAADDHSHASHGTAALQLDHGAKWKTDAPLRRGMEAIRAAVAAAHSGQPAHTQLGARIETEIDAIARECKLPPEADAQLHLVLAELIDGAAMLESADRASAGMARIAAALDAYGTHFDHHGWRPLH